MNFTFFLILNSIFGLLRIAYRRIYAFYNGANPRFGELLKEKHLENKNKFTPFFLRKTPSKI